MVGRFGEAITDADNTRDAVNDAVMIGDVGEYVGAVSSRRRSYGVVRISGGGGGRGYGRTVSGGGAHEGAPSRLNRFDLFHGHLWTGTTSLRGGGDSSSTSEPSSPVVGLLMHALEYPAYDEDSFPYNLGHCQRGSTLSFDPQLATRRNILWVASANEVGRCCNLKSSSHHQPV